MRSTTAAALAVIALLAGCSSKDKAPANTARPSSSVVTPGAAKTAETALKYMQALATQDLDKMRPALELVEPGSPAEGYALFRIEGAETNRFFGKTDPPPVTVAAQPDGSIQQARPDGAGPVTFGGFKSSAAGKLSDLSGNGQDLRTRLVKPSSQPAAAFDAKVSLAAGLQSSDAGALILVLRVETGAKPVELRISESSYTDADGHVYNPDPKKSSFGTAAIKPGSTARAVITLPGAAPGGRFIATIATEGSEPEKPELPALPY